MTGTVIPLTPMGNMEHDHTTKNSGHDLVIWESFEDTGEIGVVEFASFFPPWLLQHWSYEAWGHALKQR